MDTKYTNPCTRCGKQRIDSKSWEEKITNFMGTSTVIYTETVCPDPECQKVVEKELTAQRKKKEEMEHNKEDRKARFKEFNKRNLQLGKTPKK